MPDSGSFKGQEVFFDKDQVIVSKTNPRGIITYANRTFLQVSGFSEAEVVGKPHNVIRHPDMPRCIFKLLWETIGAGQELFAYAVNRTNNGGHYWVLAHVTPSFDAERRIVGFHSNRRVPERESLEQVVMPLYRRLRERERQEADAGAGLKASWDMLKSFIDEKGGVYDKFIFSL